MLKQKKNKMIITSVMTLLPILVGIILWNRLPEEMPIHWGTGNAPDDWASKGFAVFGLPLFLLAIHWVCFIATVADPKKNNINSKMFDIVLYICPGISVIVNTFIYSFSLGIELNVGLIMSLLMGVMFVIIGNYLPKCKQSYTMGIKLPWTLSDEDNWNKTHRLGGILWVAGGFVIIAVSPFQLFWLVGVIVAVMVTVPTVYSYMIYKKK